MNRANMLRALDRFAEARGELEDCLQVFQDDPAYGAKVLGSLAILFADQGDLPQAITQQRRVLALCEQLPDPSDRAMSHSNLAVYLERSGTPSGLAESPRHQLAALVYRLVAGLGQHLEISLNNYAILFRRAHLSGTPLAAPPLAELLTDPAFSPLADWLRQRQADVAEVQAAVDQALDAARQAALQQEQPKETSLAMTPTTPLRPLADLLAELEAAVLRNDRDRARQLEQAILQRLAIEAADRAALERSVQDLMAKLEHTAGGRGVINIDPHELVQGGASSAGVVYPVWFGTNRRPTPQGDGFTGERHDRVTRGRAEVYIPEAHRFGETGSGFFTRLLRFDLRDDRLRLQRVRTQERDAFFADINQAMLEAHASGETRHALFFLHGFNVTFTDAAIRAAQIGYDLRVPGATAFFSWPSRGSVAAYPADGASIEASERAITDFLVDFAANCGAERLHVIAHSMGNRGLLRALQRIAGNAETRGKVKFGQVFLAAPDVDRDLFLDLARLYPEHAERTTLYASDGDLAVHLSSRLHDAPRAGYFLPYTAAPGIDTVAVPDFDLDLLGHSYFAQAEALLYDIHELMHHNMAPARRQRIDAANHEGTAFWRLRR
jgi:esterase/lipase superfamily enzyme